MGWASLRTYECAFAVAPQPHGQGVFVHPLQHSRQVVRVKDLRGRQSCTKMLLELLTEADGSVQIKLSVQMRGSMELALPLPMV